MARTDTPPAGDERSVLFQMLEYVQQTALSKVRGLPQDLARRAPIPTSPLTNPASLLNHLRWVEHYWVEVVTLGREDRAPWTDESPDRELELGLELPIEEIIDGYGEQVQLTRALLGEPDLAPDTGAPPKGFPPTG